MGAAPDAAAAADDETAAVGDEAAAAGGAAAAAGGTASTLEEEEKLVTLSEPHAVRVGRAGVELLPADGVCDGCAGAAA